MNKLSGSNEFIMPELQARKLTDGLGYGDGSISNEAIREQAGSEALALAESVVTSPNILTAIDHDKDGSLVDDDGCGDGRRVKLIFAGHEERQRSLNRAKVFGGGTAMVAAIEVGSGNAVGKPLNGVFHEAINTLKAHGINFGAHTADYVHNDKDCGCGAIDKAPSILAASKKYRENIQSSIDALGVPTEGLDEVLDNFGTYADTMVAKDYSGRGVVEEIIESGKIVKQLEDAHLEGFVVLNMVPGYTVDQQAVRGATSDKVQVFAVDVPRMQKYASELYQDADSQQKAFLSELVYTLATAAVLTKGDLPVYVVEAMPAYATAG